MSSSVNRSSKTPPGIHSITVGGFKSLADEQTIEIRPLTLLAGANSSGKSSIMQPLLLLKQTLEAPYDPGPLLLHGANVKFTDARQMFARTSQRASTSEFSVGIAVDADNAIRLDYSKTNLHDVKLIGMTSINAGKRIRLSIHMTGAQIAAIVPTETQAVMSFVAEKEEESTYWTVVRSRCFLRAQWNSELPSFLLPGIEFPDTDRIAEFIRKVIHVPGLRGNPERTYRTTAVGDEFPGTFENYIASIISQWQARADGRLAELSRSLEELGLASTVEAKQIDSTQVELHVARLAYGRAGKITDTVSIADVGFGVSQTLPVLVALLAARPGQLVYIEQPEIHLHPRAQVALAPILARAAERGVRLVVETHSALLLRAVQTLVAKGELATDLVKLHWFHRSQNGATEITSADLDENGAFGQWPEDFDEVLLQTEADYLDAVTLKS